MYEIHVGAVSLLFCFVVVGVACARRQPKRIGVVAVISLYFSVHQFSFTMSMSVLVICFSEAVLCLDL